MPTASGTQGAGHNPQGKLDTVNITDFTTELFRKVDDAITDAPRHSRAIRSAGEVVAIGTLTSSKAPARALSILGSATTTVTCSPNCRNAPAACIRNNFGSGCSPVKGSEKGGSPRPGKTGTGIYYAGSLTSVGWTMPPLPPTAGTQSSTRRGTQPPAGIAALLSVYGPKPSGCTANKKSRERRI